MNTRKKTCFATLSKTQNYVIFQMILKSHLFGNIDFDNYILLSFICVMNLFYIINNLQKHINFFNYLFD
jgi:hypothetical protein